MATTINAARVAKGMRTYPLAVEFRDEHGITSAVVNIRYRRDAITPAILMDLLDTGNFAANARGLVEFICQFVTEWDWLEDNEQDIVPITFERLKHLDADLLNVFATAMQQDMSPNA